MDTENNGIRGRSRLEATRIFLNNRSPPRSLPLSNARTTVPPGERQALAEGATPDRVPALLPAVPVLLYPAVGGGEVWRDHPQVPHVVGGAEAVPRHRGSPCPGEPAAGAAEAATSSMTTSGHPFAARSLPFFFLFLGCCRFALTRTSIATT